MEDKVLEAMKAADKPVRPGDIAKTLGVESKDVSKAITKLKKEGKVISPKRCYYSVSDA
jgi:Mn-dependent DtxR family transcriptional regulator